MDRLAPRHKFWFPFFKLSLFLIVVSTVMYFTLQVFNPHLDPSEEKPKDKTARQRQVEWLMKVFQSKLKK